MAVAARKPGNEAPVFHRSLFWVRKLQTGREVLGSVFSYFFPSDSRINLHTCTSNEKQLYLLKNPNSLQEGPLFTPLVGGRP